MKVLSVPLIFFVVIFKREGFGHLSHGGAASTKQCRKALRSQVFCFLPLHLRNCGQVQR